MGLAVVSVTDVGPGVPPGAASYIFSAFKRGRADGRGSGLGLAVLRAIAKAHLGEAFLTASEAGGSRFELTAPLARAGDSARWCEPHAK